MNLFCLLKCISWFKSVSKNIVNFSFQSNIESNEIIFHCREDFAAAWMNLGIVQASLHKNSSAERSYYTALKHRKKYPDCYYNLGNLVWWLFFMLCLKCTCCVYAVSLVINMKCNVSKNLINKNGSKMC
jgi:hypothetical protein